MKIVSKIGESGRVVIPKEFRDSLGLKKNTSVEFELEGATLVLSVQRARTRKPNFELAMKRYRGAFRKQMLADGFASTDELMKHICGR
jgi:AbrB family looped-hinge helix DNA binding protein